MTPRPNAILLAIICAGLLAGCAIGGYERTLVPPQSPEGQACLPKCDLTRTQCEGRQQGRVQECLQRYSAAKSDYDTCVQSGSKDCRAPDPCQGADMEICRIQYDDCFTDCGGRVDKGFRLKPAIGSTQSAPTAAPADAGDPP
jgi:hypothetical protein